MAEDAGDQARDRVQDHHRGGLAAGQHAVADRDLLERPPVADALVEALVPPAQEQQPAPPGRARARASGRSARLRGERRIIRAFGASATHRLEAVEDRLGLDQHPGPPAEGLVVHGLAAVGREVAEVVEPHVGQPLLVRDAERPLGQEAPEEPGEEGQDVDAHEEAVGGERVRGAPGGTRRGVQKRGKMLRAKGLGSSGGDTHAAVFSGIVEGLKPVVQVRAEAGAPEPPRRPPGPRGRASGRATRSRSTAAA